MSLDTILKIGKVFREQSENPMKHFRYVSQPNVKEGEVVYFFSVPVNEDMRFDWNNVRVVPENQREKLFYLNYKTSNQDTSSPKYVFGDIYYQCDNKKEAGNFIVGDIIKKSNSFDSANKIRSQILSNIILKYYPSLKKKDLTNNVNIITDYINGKIHIDNTWGELVSNNTVIQFWKSVNDDLEHILNLLKYAPVVDSNCDSIEDEYIRFVFANNYNLVKKLVKGKKSLDLLSDEEKQALLKIRKHKVFLHLDFPNNLQWYNCKEMFDATIDSLNRQIIAFQGDEKDKVIMTTTLYNTLCSGNAKSDIQFPDFEMDNSHKSFAFDGIESFNDFLYADYIQAPQNAREKIPFSNMNIFVYPQSLSGSEISVDDYENFFFNKTKEDSLFSFNFLDFDNLDNQQFQKFDFVFKDYSSKAPRTVLELSGINRSQLQLTKDRVYQAELKIADLKQGYLNFENVSMKLEGSLRNIFGNIISDDGNVQIIVCNAQKEIFSTYLSIVLKILPKIYLGNYYDDGKILPELVQKVEFAARNSSTKTYWFQTLKYDMMLIMEIQNNSNSKYMDIINSQSYQIGLLLGKMSNKLTSVINSFEKNYVGTLSRRISTLPDFLRLKADVEEKLIMHDKNGSTKSISYELAQMVKKFNGIYDKNECSFGFFEGYYEFKSKNEKTEKGK